MSEKPLPPEVQNMIIHYQSILENKAKMEAELRIIEAELSDIENILETLKNLGDDAELYKALGHVLVKKSKADVVKELEERKELLTVKRDKYRKQLDFLTKEAGNLEGRIKEALSKHGYTTS
ncbi:prefoldin subunit beta [Desulfurococcus mucosus]|uniref:Prefoldin subunit beta n=1 Tax=Desulfurococcus mucosus (strain ATCC 35584 / DSM 2162 / JCM 9187 / O7/1) TaxID=765177 RepID=E8R7D9_DESM0|nr:prefoldin subunit beta [Desulfurococcus mucosus]ADV65604.1 prefoldin, beta subunit [Desulfurococcus mucosus DSM 2162]